MTKPRIKKQIYSNRKVSRYANIAEQSSIVWTTQTISIDLTSTEGHTFTADIIAGELFKKS